MKKFEFRLDAALRWRNTQVQLERAKLQKLLSEEQRLKSKLQLLLEEKQSALAELPTLPHLQSSDLRTMSIYVVGADVRASWLQEEIVRFAEPIRKQRLKLLEAERNVRLLDKLKADRYSEWKHAFDREIDAVAEESWLAANFRTDPQES